jgi:cation/acetate symporter
MSSQASSNRAFFNELKTYYTWYTGGFIVFLIALAILEQLGLPKVWIGHVFLFATIGLYAGIGIMARTADIAEYYVAERRVPAIFNGMATGADWMSAASFIGMAGGLYLLGFDGLAFIMGWTGGYCLVAFLLAPYLRKFGQFTIPDFLGARYGGNLARFIGVLSTRRLDAETQKDSTPAAIDDVGPTPLSRAVAATLTSHASQAGRRSAQHACARHTGRARRAAPTNEDDA